MFRRRTIIAWVGQGVVADRSKELLGRSDKGIGMMRRSLERAMAAVKEGRDPEGVWRGDGLESGVSAVIDLPGRRGSPRRSKAEWLADVRAVHSNSDLEIVPELFWLAYGQPSEVFCAFADAAGLDPEDIRSAANPFGL